MNVRRSIYPTAAPWRGANACRGQRGSRTAHALRVKVVVIGGTGLIGSKLVAKPGEHGHEAVPAAPNTGVNTLTSEGLAEVLDGAAVVVRCWRCRAR